MNDEFLPATIAGLTSKFQGYHDNNRSLQFEMAAGAASLDEITNRAVQGLSKIQEQQDILKAHSTPDHEVATSIQSLQEIIADQAPLWEQTRSCRDQMDRAYSSWKEQYKDIEIRGSKSYSRF